MPYLAVELAVVLGIYAWVLLIVMRQKHVYMDVLSQLLPRFEAGLQTGRPSDLLSSRTRVPRDFPAEDAQSMVK
jgi:hypothetical protein